MDGRMVGIATACPGPADLGAGGVQVLFYQRKSGSPKAQALGAGRGLEFILRMEPLEEFKQVSDTL